MKLWKFKYFYRLFSDILIGNYTYNYHFNTHYFTSNPNKEELTPESEDVGPEYVVPMVMIRLKKFRINFTYSFTPS